MIQNLPQERKFKAARALLDLSQSDLAAVARLSVVAVSQEDRGRLAGERYISQVIDALRSAGVKILSDKASKMTGIVFLGEMKKAN